MKKSLTLLFVFCLSTTAQSQGDNHNLIIGTYTNSCESNGIYVYNFNSGNADFELKSSTRDIINPSFLTISPDRKFIYSVNENGDKSTVSSFSYDSLSGKLNFLNKQSSDGADPCHIINDAKNVIVSNYSGGNVVVIAKNEDGSLSEKKQLLQFMGHSINEQRQEKPHLHQALFSPDKEYLLFADLGTDNIYTYKYHPEKNSDILEKYKTLKTEAGSGPRHLVFSSDGKYVYCIHELDGSLTIYSFKDGILKLTAGIFSSNPHGSTKETSAAEIAISPDGKFLYTTNRGDYNEITCYKIKKKGKLELVEKIPTLGKGPRNFTIDPSGNFLLIGHQYTNDVVIFNRDKTTGLLTDSGKRINLCSPVCLVFE